MSAKRVLLLFIVLVEVAILAVITGAGIPGAPTSATDSSQDAPMIEKLSPKCIDLSGFDQALEELLMLLKGDSVKTVTSGMLEYSSGFSLQTMDWATEAALGFPPEEIEPARMLGSLLENGPNLNLSTCYQHFIGLSTPATNYLSTSFNDISRNQPCRTDYSTFYPHEMQGKARSFALLGREV